MTVDAPQTLQQVEHALRMKETQLKTVLAEKAQIERQEGQIRCEMQRLENEKFRLLSGPLIP